MPSQRRLRLAVVAVITILFLTFYYSGEASKIQNQKFYRSTVDAMKAKEANHAKTQEKIQNAMHAPGGSAGTGAGAGAVAGNGAGDGTHDAPAPKVAIPPANEETEDIPIAGRTKMTVPKKGTEVTEGGESAQSEEDKEREIKEQKEADAKSELNDILKRAPSMMDPGTTKETTKEALTPMTVIIFSKSYCPHSKRAKTILLEHYAIQPKPFVVELDQHPLGPYLQALLGQKTGRRTVPNVLVSGKSIGGGDDIAALEQSDELASTLKSLGGKWIVDVEHLEVEKGL
ncbi:unnamed protein product [Penicillium salamii]|uniref:Glutaredoxin domain-containing protein n=1 Tax=Penicillium salamii TaxID=1612424 RepID=A0A9W4P0G3_9EURO|nr:unnamed protein product [Penicillium salamii]CAG8198030.1 unnamed protein product [Penicillium salamii]CAG8329349.1 unnamed protein product [Penicillium salamii]CAG8338682.1 unnamed protein product [Penicillium salamii]CAG8361972.1 unnamed protein product [Penicillium salamii]